MTALAVSPARARSDDLLVFEPSPEPAVATVEIVIPVYNEQDALARSVRQLHAFLSKGFPVSWHITIADNASTDRTWAIACQLAQSLDHVRAAHLDGKGRGRALRAVWIRSCSPVVAYMDVDLSTDLDAFLPLVAPLISGHSDISIGSRLAAASRVGRGPKREVISRGYNLLLKMALHAGFSDAQCGFKAARTDAVRALLPLVEDQGWFFDTELLVLAEHNGLRIHEVPVDWIDDADSRVHVVTTARDDLHGVLRLMRQLARGEGNLAEPLHEPTSAGERGLGEQLVRFASIGVVSTAAFALLFALLAGPLGTLAADAIALAACTVANTAANRRLTFALRGRSGRVRHHARGLAVALLPLTLNVFTLGVLAGVGITSVVRLLVALTAVNATAGLVRFALLDRWVFQRSRPG